MTHRQYSIANLTEKELQKLKETEKSFNRSHVEQESLENKQEIIFVAYTQEGNSK